MTVSALSAARTLCELRGWTLSNLEIQKILYLAHMVHLGKSGSPLIREDFEAWDYGPVVPALYHHTKGFGSGPVMNVFHWAPPIAFQQPEYESLREAAEGTKHMTPGQLVANTHWTGGAWSSYYRPNTFGIKIPNEAILNEYRARTAPAAVPAAIHA